MGSKSLHACRILSLPFTGDRANESPDGTDEQKNEEGNPDIYTCFNAFHGENSLGIGSLVTYLIELEVA